MYKRMSLLTAAAGLPRADFAEHWTNIHGPMIASLPGVRAYRQNVIEGETHSADGSAQAFVADGIVELYFDKFEDMQNAFAGTAAEVIADDERNFLGTSSGYSISGDNAPLAEIWPTKTIVVIGDTDLGSAESAIKEALAGQDNVGAFEIHRVETRFGAKAGPDGPQPAALFVIVYGADDMNSAALAKSLETVAPGAAVSAFKVKEIRRK